MYLLLIHAGLENWIIRLADVEIEFCHWGWGGRRNEEGECRCSLFHLSLMKVNWEYAKEIQRSVKAQFLWNSHLSTTLSDFWFATYISCFKSKFIQVDVAFSERERFVFWQQTNCFAKAKKISISRVRMSLLWKNSQKSILYKEYLCTADCLCSFSFPS